MPLGGVILGGQPLANRRLTLAWCGACQLFALSVSSWTYSDQIRKVDPCPRSPVSGGCGETPNGWVGRVGVGHGRAAQWPGQVRACSVESDRSRRSRYQRFELDTLPNQVLKPDVVG